MELYKRRLPHPPIIGGTDEQTDTVTPPKSDDHDRSSRDLVVIEAPTVEAAEEAATQPAEETQAGVRDPVEQLNDLKTRIDALMKGGPAKLTRAELKEGEVNASFHRLANRSRCPLLLGPKLQQQQIHGWPREHVAIHLAQRISLGREVTETLDMMITISELEAIIAQTVPGRLTVCARI